MYTEKPFVCITYIHVNHTIIKNGGWVLTREITVIPGVILYYMISASYKW